MNKVELVARDHDRDGFDCGVEALNNYLRQTARQHTDRGISRTFVLVQEHAPTPKPIVGFFTLNLCQLPSQDLPPYLARRLPQRIAAIKLGRLAVTKTWQRKGIGRQLLIAAFQKTIHIYEAVGGIGLFVDAKDDEARVYYEQFGFVSCPKNPLLLYLPMATIQDLLRAGD